MPDEIYPPATGKLKAGKAFADTPDGRALAAELETTTKQGRRDWEAHYGEPYPASLGDWQRLLVRAGVNPNDVLAGHIEIGDAAGIARRDSGGLVPERPTNLNGQHVVQPVD